MLIVVTFIFSAIYFLLILYYLWGWLQLKEFNLSNNALSTKVTVIIPARNEENNLPKILNDLKDQNYNHALFEVIVIDDFSIDNTSQVVKNFNLKNLKLLVLKTAFSNTNKPNKKRGIEMAVEQAFGSLIITTDADCRIGNNWIQTHVAFFEKYEYVMIAGPVTYYYDNSFLGKFQTLDFLSLVGIAAASIKNGFYNLCNGANLAYTKEAFLSVGGFKGTEHIASGDDMMLMHKLAKKYPKKIGFLKNKEAITYTHTQKDLYTFWQQRLRWTSKSTHYEDKRITAILIFVYLFNFLLLINGVMALFNPFFIKLAMWQFMVKIIIDTLFSYRIAKFFRKENLLWLFLPIQVAHIFYILLIAPAGVFGKYAWKGRKV